jgi:small-conductance mechanosensitive channel
VTASPPSRGALEEFASTRTSLLLWFGLLGGPAAAFFAVLITYAVVDRACVTRSSLVLHLLAIGFLVIATLAGLTSWRLRGRADRWPDTAGGMLTRSRFMATVGIFTSALAMVVIVMQWIPVFIIGACHGT